jgi:hypothetical protein
MRNASVLIALLLLTSGCGGKDNDDDSGTATQTTPTTGTTATAVIGAGGGSVEAGGVTVTIPAGALDGDTEIGVAEVSGIADADFATPSGTAYAFTPHGAVFAEPVTIRIPQDGTGDLAMRLDDESDTSWELVPNTTFGADYAEFEVSSFSVYLVSSRCSKYCTEVTSVCGGAATFTQGDCVSTCLSTSPGPGALTLACTQPVRDNFDCLTNPSRVAADFDCATGDALASTCAKTQGAAQTCNNPVCSDLVGAWGASFSGAGGGGAPPDEDSMATEVVPGQEWLFVSAQVPAPAEPMPDITVVLDPATGVYSASFTTTSVYPSDSVVLACVPAPLSQKIVFTFTLDGPIYATLVR